MKVLERLLLVHLDKQTGTYQDPLQFAYRHGGGVEDAIIQLLQPTHCHLDKAGSTVRVMFFDFSSAFNTIQPDVVCQKLQKTQVGASTIAWIKDYLKNRPLFVRLKNCTSNQAISNIGAPQGTVLSPYLFTLYTSDFQYKSETCHLHKYSDVSAVVRCIRDGQEAEYKELVERFVAWCENNHLTLNVNKTKEIILDFRRNRVESTTVSIMGEDVEVVEEYRYLGVHLDNRLDWRKNSKAVYKKGHSRLHFLRTLRSFIICSKMLQIFYKSVVESVISSAIVCWGSSIRSRDLKRFNSLIKKAGSVLGTTVEPLEEIMQKRILQRIKKIMYNHEHSLHKTARQWKSVFSQRLLQFCCNTDHYWRSFLPTIVVINNYSLTT
uniref:Reverse transcriptase domain-containing protein n=1 Tax=Nothobranchius furzeri TaxID=105023 RepID=A0A8C6KTV4_NOTFU